MGSLLTKPRAEPQSLRPFGGEDPFALLHSRVDDMLNDFFREGWITPVVARPQVWTEFPKLDVSYDEKSLKVVAEVPGMDEKDLQLTIEDGRLVLSGEKKSAKEEKGDNWVRRERSFGSFRRVVALPVDVLADQAEATFAHGVVTITAPRRIDEAKKPHRIEVRPGK